MGFVELGLPRKLLSSRTDVSHASCNKPAGKLLPHRLRERSAQERAHRKEQARAWRSCAIGDLSFSLAAYASLDRAKLHCRVYAPRDRSSVRIDTEDHGRTNEPWSGSMCCDSGILQVRYRDSREGGPRFWRERSCEMRRFDSVCAMPVGWLTIAAITAADVPGASKVG